MPSTPEPPMVVLIGESTTTDCQSDCRAWISAQGKIVAGQTLRRFQAVLRQLKGRKLPVFINSGGGDVAEAMAIGRLIRAKGLDTAVIKIDSSSCPAGDSDCAKKRAKGIDNGKPQSIRYMCFGLCLRSSRRDSALCKRLDASGGASATEFYNLCEAPARLPCDHLALRP